MKSLILVFGLIFSNMAFAQTQIHRAQYEPLSFGKRFIHIDPTVTVNPWPGNAPTPFALSAIDPLVGPGTILKIKQVGLMG